AKLSAVPALRPKTPCRLGPTVVRPPASIVWQILQRLNTALPASASAAAAGGGATQSAKPNMITTVRSMPAPRTAGLTEDTGKVRHIDRRLGSGKTQRQF